MSSSLSSNKKFTLALLLLHSEGVSSFGFVPWLRAQKFSPLSFPKQDLPAPKQQKQRSFGQSVQSFWDQEETDVSSCDCGLPHPTARTARILAPLASIAAAWSIPPTTHTHTLAFPTPASFSTISKNKQTPSLFFSAVERNFPNSIPTSKVVQKVTRLLRKERGYTSANTLLATSLCCDEINSKPQYSLSARFRQGLSPNNGVFTMGGLGGLPFVGKTGMKAFLSHVPSEGKVVILFGPHVGVSQKGIIGQVERLGQAQPTTSCGAAIGAYQALTTQAAPLHNNNGSEGSEGSESSDYQEDFIISKLRQTQSLDNPDSVEPLVSVTKDMSNMIRAMLMQQLDACGWQKPEFWSNIKEVCLVGGIVINQGQTSNERSREDYFQPLVMEIYEQPANGDSSPRKMDLYNQVFR